MRPALHLLTALLAAAPVTRAQVLEPTQDITIDTTPTGGVLRYTRVRIPPGVTVSFKGLPPVILCSGDIVVEGSMEVNGKIWNEPGPGGWPGGYGSIYGPTCSPGGGPGGGTVRTWRDRYGSYCQGAPGSHLGVYGSAYPWSATGGSGGGGGYYASWNSFDALGGSGGGAIALIASGAIDVRATGVVTSYGGMPTAVSHGGQGAGGSILLRGLRGVRVAGTVETSIPFFRPQPGYVRVDSYGEPPVITGKVSATALLQLPELRQTEPPRIGKWFELSSASLPGDLVAVFLADSPGRYPAPPFGVIEIGLTGVWFFAGGIVIPKDGLGPVGTLRLPVHGDAKLVGKKLWIQGINVVTTAHTPKLSNVVATEILGS